MIEKCMTKEKEAWYEMLASRVSDEDIVYFFIINTTEDRIALTPTGQIILFSSRGSAERYAREVGHFEKYLVIGLNAKKWEWFKKEIAHTTPEQMEEAVCVTPIWEMEDES